MTQQRSSTKKWKIVLGILFLCFLGSQLIRPRIDHPPVTADIHAPDEIKQILRTACYDCHSNETNLLWFDKITPANWLVAGHIEEGRKVLNFSHWDSLSKDQQKGKLFESLNQIVFNVMPIKQYTLFHPASKVSAQQVSVLRAYLGTLIMEIRPDSAKDRLALEQTNKWIQGPNTAAEVKAAPNGIAFIPDYKNWQAISSTERLDNGTMRVILGNEIAVKAINMRQTHPWPDGTSFAKVAWDQLIDPAGIIHTGEFKQVEFMIKDRKKYASTDGWGFARWVKGLQLAPYGKTALFTTECVHCHEPMRNHDFVFTTPLDPAPPVQGDPSFDPLKWKVIHSSIDPRNHTMSTLYGNKEKGAALALVTWSQKEDEHWYGALIPGTILSIEQVRFEGSTKDLSPPLYERYEGSPLKKSTGDLSETAKARTAYILGQKASVLP